MSESTKILCLCGKTLRASVGMVWVDKQWHCADCLTKMATKVMRLEKKLRREIERLTAEIGDVKRARQTVLRQNVVARLIGERSGLKFVLKILKE